MRALVAKAQIPCVETLMAKGTLQYDNAQNLGMVGMHGSYAANMAMYECDLLISLGDTDDRVTGKVSEFAKYAKIAHIDIDPSSIGKIIDVDFLIVGDTKEICIELLSEIAEIDPSHYEQWHNHLKEYAKKQLLR